MARTVRALAALVLAILFLTSPVAAANPSSGSDASWLDSAWQWVVELLLPGEEVPPTPGPNGDAGGTIDPDGVKVLGVVSEPKTEVRPAVR